CDDLVEDISHLPQPLPAGNAFSARLIAEKVHEVAGQVHGAGILIQDYYAPRSHHGPEADQLVEVHQRIQVLFGDNAAGGPTGLDPLHLLPSWNSASDIEYDLPQGHPH